MTAKPSQSDYEKLAHHLYDFVDMTDVNDFNVLKYSEMARAAIKDIHSRGKLPVVAGGTNYYIESLLFENLADQDTIFGQDLLQKFKQVNTPDAPADWQEIYDKFFKEKKSELPEELHAYIEDFQLYIPPDDKLTLEDKNQDAKNVAELHKLLQIVDPQMGNYLHTKDKRKIVNALFKYFKMSALQYISSQIKNSDDSEQISTVSVPIKESEVAYSQSKQKLRYLPILIQIRADEPVL